VVISKMMAARRLEEGAVQEYMFDRMRVMSTRADCIFICCSAVAFEVCAAEGVAGRGSDGSRKEAA